MTKVSAAYGPYNCSRKVKEKKSGTHLINKAKISQKKKFDDKYLLSSSDDILSAEDIVLGYKMLYELGRPFRMLKTTLSLRPVYHSNDDRIRSHMLLCWPPLFLVRLAELDTQLSWPKIRTEMNRLYIGKILNQLPRRKRAGYEKE